jgi:2-oxoglutarate dehydrogenase E1 component
MRMPFRKPMVVVAPKKLLRFKGATSDLSDFDADKKFQPIILDSNNSRVADNKVRKVVLCSG